MISVVRQAAQMETACRNGDLSEVQSYIEGMRMELDRFNVAVEAILTPSGAELT